MKKISYVKFEFDISSIINKKTPYTWPELQTCNDYMKNSF